MKERKKTFSAELYEGTFSFGYLYCFRKWKKILLPLALCNAVATHSLSSNTFILFYFFVLKSTDSTLKWYV